MKECESIVELKTSNSLTFEEVSSETIVSIMKKIEFRLKKGLMRNGSQIEQYLFIIAYNVFFNKNLNFSSCFKSNIVQIGSRKLELFAIKNGLIR